MSLVNSVIKVEKRNRNSFCDIVSREVIYGFLTDFFATVFATSCRENLPMVGRVRHWASSPQGEPVRVSCFFQCEINKLKE